MTDRLTQVQDLVNVLSGHFRDSIGILHVEHERRVAQSVLPNGGGPGDKQSGVKPEAASSGQAPMSTIVEHFVKTITKTTQDLDRCIGLLPNIRAAEDAQIEAIEALQDMNEKAAKGFQETVSQAEGVLSKVREALRVISSTHYNLDGTTSLGNAETKPAADIVDELISSEVSAQAEHSTMASCSEADTEPPSAAEEEGQSAAEGKQSSKPSKPKRKRKQRTEELKEDAEPASTRFAHVSVTLLTALIDRKEDGPAVDAPDAKTQLMCDEVIY